jgi:hypothetical protein
MRVTYGMHNPKPPSIPKYSSISFHFRTEFGQCRVDEECGRLEGTRKSSSTSPRGSEATDKFFEAK